MLIWFFRGNERAQDFIKKISYENRLTSSFCMMELIQGCLDKHELKAVKEFMSINISSLVHPDDNISEKAILLLEKHSLSDGLRTIDALIAASALNKGAALATSNYKHFKKISGLSVLKFEPA